MHDFLFHIGMGKTGTSSIQYALDLSADRLAAKGLRYLGMWMGAVRPEFDGFAGFQSFLALDPSGMAAAADALIAALDADPANRGGGRFVISNEQFLENAQVLVPFFRRLSERARVRLVIYARAPESWLPSACAQWGLLHKTNVGPIQPVATVARRLIAQYDSLRDWHAAFGDQVLLRIFDPKVDVVADFGTLIGVDLRAPARNLQVRPSRAELLLRAAFNNSRPGMSLPDDFDLLKLEAQPAGTAVTLSDKYRRAFDYDAIPAIIAERQGVFDEIDRAFGVKLRGQSTEPSPPLDLAALSDEVIGSLMDIVGVQAAQLVDLRARVERLERAVAAASAPAAPSAPVPAEGVA